MLPTSLPNKSNIAGVNKQKFFFASAAAFKRKAEFVGGAFQRW